jgi:hypothetical protein
MAKSTEVAQKDAYLESITAQINEIDERIRSANNKLFEEKEKLETIKRHYVSFKKKSQQG